MRILQGRWEKLQKIGCFNFPTLHNTGLFHCSVSCIGVDVSELLHILLILIPLLIVVRRVRLNILQVYFHTRSSHTPHTYTVF